MAKTADAGRQLRLIVYPDPGPSGRILVRGPLGRRLYRPVSAAVKSVRG